MEEAPKDFFRVFMSAEPTDMLRFVRACVIGEGADEWDNSEGQDKWLDEKGWVFDKEDERAIAEAPAGPKPADVSAGVQAAVPATALLPTAPQPFTRIPSLTRIPSQFTSAPLTFTLPQSGSCSQ